MAKRLLIGGPKDGEVYIVNDDDDPIPYLKFQFLPEPRMFWDMSQIVNDVKIETYALAKFACGPDKVVSLYVHESVPLDSVMERLIANYRPEKKK